MTVFPPDEPTTVRGLASSRRLPSVLFEAPDQLLDALPTAVYITDPDGKLSYYNTAAVELWGRRPVLGEETYCGSWKLYHPDGRPMPHSECPMALALSSGEPVRGTEAVLERPDGTRVPFIPFPTPMRDASGALLGAVNVLVDISERKRVERDSSWLAAIVESSDDAIISKDLNGIITSWNQGAQRIFGYSAEEMIGKSVMLLIPAGRHNEEPGILERIGRGERIHHYETARLRKDGSLIDISLTVSPIKDSRGTVIGASKIARDISDRKEAQERREMLTREIHHRTKNLFAVVQAVAARSFAGKSTVQEAETAVLSRLHSLAQTHVLLVDKDWRGADLREVVDSEMAPYKDKVIIEGPHVGLSAQAAQNFALALHELATNAAKYGALSTQRGVVYILWTVSGPEGQELLTFTWQERGGPQVKPPVTKGFGTAVLEQVMAQYFDPPPGIQFEPDGLRYQLIGPLDGLVG